MTMFQPLVSPVQWATVPASAPDSTRGAAAGVTSTGHHKRPDEHLFEIVGRVDFTLSEPLASVDCAGLTWMSLTDGRGSLSGELFRAGVLYELSEDASCWFEYRPEPWWDAFDEGAGESLMWDGEVWVVVT
jgi:hypothetical protein